MDRFVSRELAAFHSETFRRIRKEGDARKLAATMLAGGEIPRSALALLSDHDWSARLGMMVVLEEIGTHRPELARRACPYLVALLGHQDPNGRGDAAFLLGLIGDATVLEGLEPLAEDGSPEVVEAAKEAIKRIRIFVGRALANDIILPNPSVSKSHAHFTPVPGTDRLQLVDMFSSNGTFVNGQKIPPFEKHRLEDYDEIRFGPDYFLIYCTPRTFYQMLKSIKP